MSLGPREATVKLTLGGVVADEFYARYQRAVVQAINRVLQQARDLEADIPQATGDLRRAFTIESNLYGQEKTFKLSVNSRYAEYLLETGRKPGTRPPWNKVKEWAQIKGVDLRQARAWWWAFSKQAKQYKSPSGTSLRRWWSTNMMQLKFNLERELKVALTTAGFSPQDVQVTWQ